MKSNKAVLILTNDGYEALYVNNKLVEEGSPINQGFSRTKYFSKLAKNYGFNVEELEEKQMSNEDDEEISNSGCFYNDLSEYTNLV